MHTFEQRVRELEPAARAAAAGSLRALREHRRRRAEHALGQHRRVGRPLAGLDLSQGRCAAASASSSCSAQMRQNPGLYLPVIELMYLCMSLGFQGQYRLSPRGPAELDRLREETYAVIVRQRQAPEPELSPHWKGVAAPYRGVRMAVPVWVVASAGPGRARRAVCVVLDRLSMPRRTICSRACRRCRRRGCRISSRAAPVRAAAAATRAASSDRLCTVLEPEVKQGVVAVTARRPTRSCASTIAACLPRAARRSTRASCRC